MRDIVLIAAFVLTFACLGGCVALAMLVML
jgi:hypothetical protein